ncbi:hypothetical protein [Streptosporangium sp. KLBMP 9127]|nr:hypothetical protein [Streptosporangium sp. KLBMP 9127]MCG5220796.1 hypothetical protein [Streptosporangium sp. KLBMP 9127]
MDHLLSQLTGILDALDARLPSVRFRVRRFPDGVPYLRLTDLEVRRAALFVQDGQWIYLGEDRSGTAFEKVVGQVGDPPEDVVGQLVERRGVPRPRALPVRLAWALAVGVASAAGAWILLAVILALLVPGDGYIEGSQALPKLLNAVAAVAGLGIGWWLALRSWLSSWSLPVRESPKPAPRGRT